MGGGQTCSFRVFIIFEVGPPTRPHVWPELLAEFRDSGAQMAGSHAPPKYGRQNSHIYLPDGLRRPGGVGAKLSRT